MSTPEVHDNEFLYRQVGPGGNPIYIDPTQARPLHRSVFLPTKKDVDGLSLIRGRFRTEVWAAYRVEQPEVRFRLARVYAEVLNSIARGVGIQGLSYLPTPDRVDSERGEPWAHCVITEINRKSYDSDRDAKRQIKEWAFGVANLVGNEDVIGPFEEPADGENYRSEEE